MSRFSNFFEATKDTDVRMQVREILKRQKDKAKKGLLIVFEGIDGAGKSTQTELLEEWLEFENYDVKMTKWNSHDIMHDAIKQAKDERILTPMLYCLMHASDFILRYENEIIPWLDDNKIVIADRWIYTSIVRDRARGVNVEILNEIYKDVKEPDIVFHCVLPIHKAFTRLVKEKDLSYYGTGMDLNLADNKEDNYLKYEHMLDKDYKKILPPLKSYHRLNMDRSIDEIHEEVRDTIKNVTGIGKYSKE